MNSLKKKFGKFAVSNKMASQLIGGYNWCCENNPSVCRTAQSTATTVCGTMGDTVSDKPQLHDLTTDPNKKPKP